MKTFRSLSAMALTLLLLFTTVIAPIGVLAQEAEVNYISYVNPLYPDTKVQAPLYAAKQPMLAADTYNSTLADAGAVMREGMELRASTISVGYVVNGAATDAQMQQYADDIFDEAVKHTGEPTEGDYLLWHFSSYSGNYSHYTSSGKTYITYNFRLVYLSTAWHEQQMDSAVDRLLDELDVFDASDYEKVCAVYDYICENITYDYVGLENEDNLSHTAYAALIKNTAVCQGYASLFYRLALSLDVDARLIAGYGAGGRHGWNIVELSGKYYNLDSTWDAGSTQYDYFLKAESNFGDHSRFEEYDTAAFHAAYPMSPTDYDPEADSGDTPPPPPPPSTDVDSGYCGDALTWQLSSNGVLQIQGNGEMTSAPWKGKTIHVVNIANGVTSVCDQAFAGCTAVASVFLPNSLETVGVRAFEGCTSIASVAIPANVQWIGSYAFADCTALTNVRFAAGVETIGDYAFANCGGLTYVQLPNGTQSIGQNAFAGCSLLQTVDLADTVSEILGGAFQDCVRLSAIEIPPGVYVLYEDTFKNCVMLADITIPKSVVIVGVDAFSGCTALSQVRYSGTAAQWAQIHVCDGNDCLTAASLYTVRSDGWVKDGGKWYFYENGIALTNVWRKDSKGWVHLGADGAMETDKWTKDSKGWCYVGANGYAVTNCWKKDSHGWIYLDANGSMTKSKWVKTNNKWYYCDAQGYMLVNTWQKDSKGWVYVGADGAMVTNKWVKDSKGWCYVGANGYAVTNCWKKDSHGWIYLDANGSMTKSKWLKDGGKWYYLDANGYMIANATVIISGKKYTFNASGVWVG